METHLKRGGKRRRARELAVQFLYQYDLAGGGSLDELLTWFWQIQPAVSITVRKFAEELIRGCIAQRDAIDCTIRRYAENWELPRMATVDRNILRLAIYEMTCRADIPPVVSINEAIEIAKRYSTAESGAFVNGILDRLRADLPRPARTATGN
ncbi:MAG: transcription antitermination factor NusB [Verrucomicrobiae bacterium]|nr:transcription antitermination factor NusB [Verrucomicrobiae bacterium]